MWRRTLSAILVMMVALIACARDGDQTATQQRGPGADTPQEAVRELIDHLKEPDFTAASNLLVPGQAALASLVEGATFAQVADAISEGDADVASNFWAGFAQGAGGFLTGTITIGDGPVVTEGETEFQTVDVLLTDGGERRMVTRDVDGFRVDLFASFGGGLADKMIPPVERLLSSQTDDAKTILPALKNVVPSLLVAVNQPDLTPQAIQDILRLVELITRIS